MKTKQTYSVEFKEQALSKVLQRGNRTVGAVADELNVNVLTLRKWMGGIAAANRSSGSADARRPEDWSLEERLMALQESHGLADEALNGWCRERGLFAHHLAQWRADFCTGGAAGSRRESAQEVRDLKQANVQLQRELKRKEKALAEAAHWPAYPLKAFDTLLAARTWVGALVRWYNDEHRHSAIRFVTPAQRHANLDQDILDRRAALYESARQRNPLRWKGRTRNWQRVDAVHLNPERIDDQGIHQQRRNQERKAA
ncbi:transposase [Paraburkholderia sacchari]